MWITNPADERYAPRTRHFDVRPSFRREYTGTDLFVDPLDLFGGEGDDYEFGGEGDDYEFVGMDFEPPVDIPASAESHGARGQLVEEPDEIGSALADAMDREGPGVLDVLVHD